MMIFEDGINWTPLDLTGRGDAFVRITDGGQVARITTRLSSYVMASIFGVVGFSMVLGGSLGLAGVLGRLIYRLSHSGSDGAIHFDPVLGIACIGIGSMFMLASILMMVAAQRNSVFDKRTGKCLLKFSMLSPLVGVSADDQKIDFPSIRCLQTLSYRTKPNFQGRYEDLCQLNLVLVDGKRINLTFCGTWQKEMDKDAQVLADFLGVPIAKGLLDLAKSES